MVFFQGIESIFVNKYIEKERKQYNCIVFSVYNVYYTHEERKMKFKELEKILLKDGWLLIDIKGSHYQYKHKNKKVKITIPMHRGDLALKTANSILKQAGLK
jgi:predicted RNA binding protein YcfA (HicA-like mRNA interferase family)